MTRHGPGIPNADRGRAAARIGDLLLERHLVTPEQIERALIYQRERRPNRLLGQVLLEMEFITAEKLLRTVAEASGISFTKVDRTMVEDDAFKTLPRKFIQKYDVLPLSLSDDVLTVALQDFSNLFLVEDIERLSGADVHLVAATCENVREVIRSLTGDVEEFTFDPIVDEIQGEELTVVEREEDESEDLTSAASDSPVIKLVNQLIHGAIREKASDIHIEPEHDMLRVRYRVDGDLYQKLKLPHGIQAAVVSRIKIMAGMDISERRIPQDGGITVMLEKRAVDLRVSTMPGKFGEKVVIRVIDRDSAALDLERLGFSDVMLGDLRRLIEQPTGVILVTGPTGSGKSTTLYGILAEVSSTELNISTIEDPVEYNLHGVNQFQVNEKAGFTFAKALRALLRQDPDVVMVGEVRDGETAQIAVQAALTGHLVLSTLHTNDATGSITRLTNMGVEPYLVAAALRGVLAQRLMRRICDRCKQPQQISPIAERVLHKLLGDPLPIDAFYDGTGCDRCRGTGCSGRIGVYELFVPDEEILEAVARGATIQEIRRLADAAGYTTLKQDGSEKVAAGLGSAESFLAIVPRQ